MDEYIAKATVVKVSVGPATGNRVARFIRAGAPIPDGVDQDLLDALAKRGLIIKVEATQQPPAAPAEKADAETAAKAKADAEAAAKTPAGKEAAAKAAAK